MVVEPEFLTAFELELQQNPNQTINAFYRKYLAYIKWDQSENAYRLINQGSLLAHLYGMIVYPKATLTDDLPLEKKLNELSTGEWGKWKVLSIPNQGPFKDKDESEWTFEFFLRKLRNSISHGRVEVDSTMNFIFYDEDGTKIKYEINELVKFVYKLYGTYLDDWKF